MMMNRAITVSTIATCFLGVLIAGCAAPNRSFTRSSYSGMAKSSPLGSVSSVTPDSAYIRIHRPSAFFGILVSTPIKFNGRKVGKLSSGSSLQQFVSPGYLEISSNYRLKPFHLVVKGGHEYLIDVVLGEGRFELVSDVLVASSVQASEPPTMVETGPAAVEPDGGNAIQRKPVAEWADEQTPATRGTTSGTAAKTHQEVTTPSTGQTGELRGKVIGVDGRFVRIAVESGMRPRVGDTVRIGQTLPGFDELVFMAGEWTVTKITSGHTLAEAGPGVSGTPGRGYVAIISSGSE